MVSSTLRESLRWERVLFKKYAKLLQMSLKQWCRINGDEENHSNTNYECECMNTLRTAETLFAITCQKNTY